MSVTCSPERKASTGTSSGAFKWCGSTLATVATTPRPWADFARHALPDGHGVADASQPDCDHAQHECASRKRPCRLAPNELDHRYHQADDPDRERAEQRCKDRIAGALRAAALRRAVIQKGEGEQPHERPDRPERHCEN